MDYRVAKVQELPMMKFDEDKTNLASARLCRVFLRLPGLLLKQVKQSVYRCDSAPWEAVLSMLIVTSFLGSPAYAEGLQASWYSVASLKHDGQWAITKGVCADGSLFQDGNLTCASVDYKLGSILKVTNTRNGKSVIVKVTDRINRRFKGKRIDLSKGAFSRIAFLKQGLIPITVERIR